MDQELAKLAYDDFAPVYDRFTAANNYEMWLGEMLLPELGAHGLRRGSALDVGCGTGRAFDPLLDRGWTVVGCDLSSGMLAQAARKFGSRVQLLQGDARHLDPSTRLVRSKSDGFELVLMLNEVINYLTDDGDLDRVFQGVRRMLAADGLFVFDANTLAWFRESFASGVSVEMSARGWDWVGLTETVEVGGCFEARLSGKHVQACLHRQRHWTPTQVEAALEDAGLRLLSTVGQRESGGRVAFEAPFDEERDSKVVRIVGLAH